MRVWKAPRGRGPYGITTTPGGDVYFASLAGNYIARIDVDSGQATVIEPPTPTQGARRVWSDSRGRIWVSYWNTGQVGMYDPAPHAWREWRLPGNAHAYAVWVDDRDKVWFTDWTTNAIVRFDPVTENFESFPSIGRGQRAPDARSRRRSLGCGIGARSPGDGARAVARVGASARAQMCVQTALQFAEFTAAALGSDIFRFAAARWDADEMRVAWPDYGRRAPATVAFGGHALAGGCIWRASCYALSRHRAAPSQLLQIRSAVDSPNKRGEAMRYSVTRIAVAACFGLATTAALAGEITLYENPGFQGRRMTLRGTTPDLDRTQFNDRAESIVVREGVWEVCTDARFSGRCVRLQPGEYPNLQGDLNNRISSAPDRAIRASAAGRGPRPRPWRAGEGGPLRGRRLPRPVVRAACSGTSCATSIAPTSTTAPPRCACTAGIGSSAATRTSRAIAALSGREEYPDLPGNLNRKISSGRRISDQYPYGGAPNSGDAKTACPFRGRRARLKGWRPRGVHRLHLIECGIDDW